MAEDELPKFGREEGFPVSSCICHAMAPLAEFFCHASRVGSFPTSFSARSSAQSRVCVTSLPAGKANDAVWGSGSRTGSNGGDGWKTKNKYGH